MNDYLIKLACNEDEKRIIARLIELAQRAVDGIGGASDFLDLRQQELARAVAVNHPDIIWRLDGGYEEAERQRLTVAPLWETEPDNRITYLRIIHKEFKQQSLGHRDYLGAVVNLGLKREKLGDIVVQDNIAFLIVDVSIADFICQQLNRVKHCSVAVEIISRTDFVYEPPELKTIQISLASLRLDAAIAAAFKLSRSEVDNYIEGGAAKINHREVYKCSAAIKAGDLISVRGLGRFRLEEMGGTSRKGRHYVKISRY